MRIGLAFFLWVALGIGCSDHIYTNNQKEASIGTSKKSGVAEPRISDSNNDGLTDNLNNNIPEMSPALDIGMPSAGGAPSYGIPPSGAAPNLAESPAKREGRAHEPNGWIDTQSDRLSTFAADVDTGSYTLARAMLNTEKKPTPEEIRVEEFLNYFPYNYPQPDSGEAFSVTLDSAPSPFAEDASILRVGIKGHDPVENQPRKRVNLVFLTDVSGSMMGAERLDLAKSAMETLVNSLHEDDQIAIVTYASSSEVVLPLTPIASRAAVIDGIYSLQAFGSTAMGDGINLAYNEAEKGLSEDSITRIVVLSDGDANVGNVSPQEILATIAEQVNKGIYLTTVGFGLGNYRDSMMEQLANKGNGNYYYVDSLTEARRVFQAEVTGTLNVIAKDLKIQVDFDPEKVASYRLLGYENRDIADEDFRNDVIDAGELGPGHRVTALYEVKLNNPVQDGLAAVRLRYKDPEANDEIVEKEFRYLSQNNYDARENAPHDFRLALTAAGFAEVLRESPHRGNINLDTIAQELGNILNDNSLIEAELLSLIRKAQVLVKR